MSFHTEPFNVAWRVSNLIQIPIGVAFIILSFWYPESPRWLLEKNSDNTDRVLAVLCKLRMGTPESEHVRTEFHELVSANEARKRFNTGYKGLFTSPGMRKRLAYGLYATALQQAGGIAALTMYATLVSGIMSQLSTTRGLKLLTFARSTNPWAGMKAIRHSLSTESNPLCNWLLCLPTRSPWTASAGSHY